MGVRIFSRWAALPLALAAPAFAETEPPAVWFRASETCPSGAQFLEKLAAHSRKARLAQAGDHIDFVVTLVADGRETVGRLERQTDAGIVAIRELRDATCEEVADALALSLGLALAPRATDRRARGHDIRWRPRCARRGRSDREGGGVDTDYAPLCPGRAPRSLSRAIGPR